MESEDDSGFVSAAESTSSERFFSVGEGDSESEPRLRRFRRQSSSSSSGYHTAEDSGAEDQPDTDIDLPLLPDAPGQIFNDAHHPQVGARRQLLRQSKGAPASTLTAGALATVQEEHRRDTARQLEALQEAHNAELQKRDDLARAAAHSITALARALAEVETPQLGQELASEADSALLTAVALLERAAAANAESMREVLQTAQTELETVKAQGVVSINALTEQLWAAEDKMEGTESEQEELRQELLQLKDQLERLAAANLRLQAERDAAVSAAATEKGRRGSESSSPKKHESREGGDMGKDRGLDEVERDLQAQLLRDLEAARAALAAAQQAASDDLARTQTGSIG
eukprot:TRINITY_DN836_c0_g1_i4.p1 TRINITY_DN836_c0_g1~~TRINITY_DN836_c0_g1_i4.p1  ORF type:complete len:392 (-),score=91.48 TRINITY_DN836_c0_g1_i4:147-1184(-)